MRILGYEITRERKAAQLAFERVQSTPSQSGEQGYLAYVKQLYKSPTVASCVGVWTSTLNEAPLKVSKQPNHPLELLFKRPNDYLSESLLWQYVAMYCSIGGNAYLHKIRNGLGQTVEMHVYNDSQIQPVSKGIWIDHYLYNFNNVKVEILAQDIIHLRSHLINPTKHYLGLSPMAYSGKSISIDNALTDIISSTMNNGGLPPSTLKYKGQSAMNQTQIELVKEQYSEHLRNKGRGKLDILLLPSDIDKIQEANFAELQMSTVWSKTDVDICGAYRVPIQVAQTYAGLSTSTYNNVKEAYKQWTELSRIPLWNLWEEQIQLSFSNEYPNIDVEFDTSVVQALKPDKDKVRSDTIASYEKGIITKNEARMVLGYTWRDDGDSFNVPAPTVTLSSSVEPDLKSIDIESFDTWSEEKKVNTWKKYDTIATKAAEEIATAFSDSLNGLEKEVVRGVKSEPFDFSKWIAKLVDATKRSREDLIAQIITEAWKDAGALDDLGDAKTNIFVKATQESADKIAESIGTIRDEVKELLKKNAGKTESELIDLLKSKFDTLKESRANLIGRTTATSASNGTKKKVIGEYNDRNPKKQLVRVWLSSRDPKTRSSHSSADGQHEDEDGMFTINGHKTEYPAGSGLPASEACNCRCITISQRKK